MFTSPNYWEMSDAELADSHAEIVTRVFGKGDTSGENAETLAFIEDAILQRIGAPDDADPNVPDWQARIVEFANAHSVTPA